MLEKGCEVSLQSSSFVMMLSVPALEFAQFAAIGVVLNLLLRLVVSMVLLVAAAGKALEPGGGRGLLEGFGLPRVLIAPVLALLPYVEGTLGLALLLDHCSQVVFLMLALLFALFSLAILKVLLERKVPLCHCFGAVYSAPVSTKTLLRSQLLFLACLVGGTLPTYPLTKAPLGVFAALVCYFGLAYSVFRFSAWRGMRLKPAPFNIEADAIFPKIHSLDGFDSQDFLSPKTQTIILLTSPNCDACFELKHSLVTWLKTISSTLSIAELSAQTESRRAVEVRLPRYYEINISDFERFGLEVPSAILVDSSGKIVDRAVSGRDEIAALLRSALKQANALKQGPGIERGLF